MAKETDDEFFRMREMVQKRDKEISTRFKEQSKQRLRKNITSRMRTTMIGSLAVFEKYLGFLWGHDSGRNLTSEQKALKGLWEDIRAEILDMGNANIRAIEDELLHYNCEWQRYKTEIAVHQDIKEKQNER